ncbi:MAG: transglycosylase domain-containing protein, partial [Hyphomicrobiales bacterium]
MFAWGLPDEPSEKLLFEDEQQYSVIFTDKQGNVLGRRGVFRKNELSLDEVPPYVLEAVLATEDARFYQHFGVDIIGTMRAMVENVKANGVVQGGSTLTQQVAKNLFLTPERTIRRKLSEAFLALWMEARLTKKQILKLYIDRAYLGSGAFGIEAAAEFYFDKSLTDISLNEAVMLAGLFKAPTRFSPHRNLPAARARANVVLERMVKAGFITEGQARMVRRKPASLAKSKDKYIPEYFLDWAYEEVQRLADGKAFVLIARTTIDMVRQEIADNAVKSILRQDGVARGVSEAALVSVTLDGAVQAMVGGSDYGESQFNRATNAKRQPGSSFKPFVYLTALENGFTPKSIVIDGPICIKNWCPKNYSRRYRGRITLKTALTKSINVIPIRLARSFGRKKIAATARKLGIRTELRLNASMPLGTNEVTVLDMTGAFATFANGGLSATPYGIVDIRTQDGKIIYDRKRDEPPQKRLVARDKIEQLDSMLGNVVLAGTARRAQLGFTPAAGKTGTTQSYRDAWFMGFTGTLATGVWMGNDNFSETKRLTGGSLPAETWRRYMSAAIKEKYATPLPGIELYGTPRPVETQPARKRRLAQAEQTRKKRDTTLRYLRNLSELFTKGIAGPVVVREPAAARQGERANLPTANGQQVAPRG